MARWASLFVLLGFLSTSVLAEYNETLQHINADCDNGCFFSSFPGGSCTTDAACMCDQQKYREAYFCCMAKKCAPNVLPDSIVRQTSDCEARNMPFTFNEEAACGISPSSSASVATVTVTASGDSKSSAATTSASSSTSVSAVTSGSAAASGSSVTSGSTAISGSPTGSQTSSGSTPTSTANSASVKRVGVEAVVLLVAAGVLV